MLIKSYYDPPPIPTRKFDYWAYDDETYDAGSPIGFGKTEIEAIRDLLDQLEAQETTK